MKPCGNKSILFYLIFSCIGTFSLLLVLIFVLGPTHHHGDAYITLNLTSICVPCDDLTFDKYEPTQVNLTYQRIGSETGISMCCPRNEEDFDRLLNTLLERTSKIRQAQEPVTEGQWNCYFNITGNQPTLAIKLVGRVTHQTGTGKGVLSWDTDSPNAFATKGLQYNKAGTKIKVKQSGSYFLYSQVTLQKVASTSLRNVRVTVIRETSSIEEWLMGRSETLANTSTLYLGGRFDLKKGDHVNIYVENLENIVPSAISNFFGMFLS